MEKYHGKTLDEWIDVFDKPPTEPQTVIIYFKNSVGWHVGTAWWDGSVFMDMCEECGVRNPYTATTPIKKWMSLPKPPIVSGSGKCSSCEVNDAQLEHTCPYKEEMRDDSDSLCDCCSECEHECAMDV